MSLRLPRGSPCLPNLILQVDQILIASVCSGGQVTAGPMCGARGQVGQRYLGGVDDLLQTYGRNFEGIHKASTSPSRRRPFPPAQQRLRSGSELHHHHHHAFLLLPASTNPQRWRFFVTRRYEKNKVETRLREGEGETGEGPTCPIRPSFDCHPTTRSPHPPPPPN